MFSNNLEKQAKYQQEKQKHFFQPSWQSKRPWFSFAPGISVPTNSCTMDMMYWEAGHMKVIKMFLFHSHAILLPFFPIFFF